MFYKDIDRLRGVAILLVVVSHMVGASKETMLGHAAYGAIRGATWPFVFIAGYLMAHLAHRYSVAGYLTKKVQGVIIPYIAVATITILLGLTRVPVERLSDIPAFILEGHQIATPLWFIPMIAVFYIGFPLYRAMLRYPKMLAVIAALMYVVSIIAGRPKFDAGPLANFTFFQSAWMAGMVWRVYRDKIDEVLPAYYPFIFMFLMAASIYSANGPDEVRHAQVLMMLPLSILLLPMLRADSAMNPVWEWLASRSFGIFFLHGVVTNAIVQAYGRDLPLWQTLPLGIALTFACGYTVSLLRQGFGTRSRYLVGA